MTEPFSQTPVDQTRAHVYLAVAERAYEIFPPPSYARLLDTRWFQLFRNHLLAEALRRHPNCPDTTGRVMIIRHPSDIECAGAVAGYRGLLHHVDASFVDAPLDNLLDAWTQPAAEAGKSTWIDYLRVRYLDLTGSEPAWSRR